MSDVPAKKNHIDIIMSNATPVCPPEDPWYTAVMYEAHLEHVDPEEPLWRVPYFGQVVRAGTVEENFEARKGEHETGSIRDPKDLGFHAVIGMFGADKIAWRIVNSKSGPRSVVQTWANAEEKRLIAEHGGVLRDMDAKLAQTLNLTDGGKGDCASYWEAIDARRRRALNKFKAAMESHVAEYKSALVPQCFVDEDGYPLGERLSQFRRGQMRRGLPDQRAIEDWAAALPSWAWNAQKAEENRAIKSQNTKNQMANMSPQEKSERSIRLKKTLSTAASKALRSQISKDWHTNASPEAKVQLLDRQIATKNAKTPEEKAEERRKQKATLDTDESVAKRCKSATERRSKERLEELIRARVVALPFHPDRSERAKLRKASNLVGLRKNPVLYMISKDGLVIFRVNISGDLQKANIVGPVVDPVLPDAFDSD